MLEAIITIPPGPAAILERLIRSGFSAYAVGGCVRDALLGRTPNDWDICTSARPEQAAACFAGLPVIQTGLRHGTITVRLDGAPYEVTTFRVDGTYSDGRHPDTVGFVSSLEADLARRDFTINAMAAGPDGRVVDLHGGRSDLAAGLVRCVGDPDRRFQEDALRLLRAARFAAAYGFSIEPRTAAAMHRRCAGLARVAPERVRAELERLLPGPGAGAQLLAFSDLCAVFWPELTGTRPPSPGWQAAASALDRCPAGLVTRLALLLGRAGSGAPEQAGALLRRLRFDSCTIRQVCALVPWTDTPLPPEPPALLRWLARLGPEGLRRLMALQRALALSAPDGPALERLGLVRDTVDRLLDSGACFSLGQLAVDGRDLQALGAASGPEMGRLLRALLEQVMDGSVQNRREALVDAARRLITAQNSTF